MDLMIVGVEISGDNFVDFHGILFIKCLQIWYPIFGDPLIGQKNYILKDGSTFSFLDSYRQDVELDIIPLPSIWGLTLWAPMIDGWFSYIWLKLAQWRIFSCLEEKYPISTKIGVVEVDLTIFFRGNLDFGRSLWIVLSLYLKMSNIK